MHFFVSFLWFPGNGLRFRSTFCISLYTFCTPLGISPNTSPDTRWQLSCATLKFLRTKTSLLFSAQPQTPRCLTLLQCSHSFFFFSSFVVSLALLWVVEPLLKILKLFIHFKYSLSAADYFGLYLYQYTDFIFLLSNLDIH